MHQHNFLKIGGHNVCIGQKKVQENPLTSLFFGIGGFIFFIFFLFNFFLLNQTFLRLIYTVFAMDPPVDFWQLVPNIINFKQITKDNDHAYLNNP